MILHGESMFPYGVTLKTPCAFLITIGVLTVEFVCILDNHGVLTVEFVNPGCCDRSPTKIPIVYVTVGLTVDTSLADIGRNWGPTPAGTPSYNFLNEEIVCHLIGSVIRP